VDELAATFLGHQGWLLSAGDSHVLVDPLLGERFGLLGVPYPPRRFVLDELPAISAVIVTHEHDDHFDPASLADLPRNVPIYLPRRASLAAWTVLREIGFEVRALEPGDELWIGDMRMCSVAVPGDARGGGDEWEVSPFSCSVGASVFASTVDLPSSDLVIETFARLHARPGLWTIANNTTYSGWQDALAERAPVGGDDELLADVLVRRHDQLVERWGAPQVSCVVGAGWSFVGEREWLNHEHFPIDPERLCALLEQRRPDARFVAPAPGQRFVLREGELIGVEQAAFVRTVARELWPDRSFRGEVVRMPDYTPACGRRNIDESELAALLAALDDFAAYLYGSPLFAAVCALPSTLADGCVASFCFALRNGDEMRVLAYDASGCRFVAHDCSDPIATFASGLECWAADLLAFMRGELSPSALCFAGRMRYWNHQPRRLRISPSALWRFGHPLRRPWQTLARYRKLISRRE
jgi:hypothetical protein